MQLTQTYSVNHSPLTVKFEPRGTLTFTKKYSVSVSPLLMRFGNGEPQPVETKLLSTEFLVESGTVNKLGNSVEIIQALLTEEATELDITRIDSTNKTTELDIDCRKSVLNLFNQLSLDEQSESVSTSLSAEWLATLKTRIKKDEIAWLKAVELLEERVNTPWLDKSLLVQSTIYKWRNGPAQQSEHVISYGRTEIEYICYRSVHPLHGHVDLTFTSAVITPKKALSLMLPEYTKTCYWGLPGGLVRADDDIPTLDIKIPIEPQIQRSYIMKPTITCERKADSLKVLITSFTYNHSRGQFCGTGSIKFCSRIDMERAVGHELSIMVNGYEFIVICEQPSKSRSFGNSSYTAQFRSRFAELSEPYARATNYTNQTPKTLAGIMNDVLVNTGWTLDNQMTDYPVPANAFSYRKLTPAGALLSIAQSIGAILDIDEVNKVVSVVPEWPVNPWDTETAVADVIINDSLILEHNTRTLTQAEHTAVFVRGEQQGVACKVTRAGTAGDLFADDVVDSLITDNQAARQRGTCELARSGNKEESTLRTKVTAQLPPIRPGMLLGIRYEADIYKATTDSMSITASKNSQGAITVNQTIKVLSNV